MERFVQLITGGGIALVAGLWCLAVFSRPAIPWITGTVFLVLGSAGLLLGIAIPIERS
jgi:hypothetical protein